MVTLGVKDLARARAFYEALGWSGAIQPDNEVAFYQAGGMVFGLWAALGGPGALRLSAGAERAGARRRAPTGAATRAPSPIPRATCGRLPTIRTGRWRPTARSTSASALRDQCQYGQ